MDCFAAIIYATIITILLLIIINKFNVRETYRIKARAYHSCPPAKCADKLVTPDQLLIINPFMWPYSGSAAPQSVLVSRPPSALMENNGLGPEPDHETSGN